jgi:hypothetical protein
MQLTANSTCMPCVDFVLSIQGSCRVQSENQQQIALNEPGRDAGVQEKAHQERQKPQKVERILHQWKCMIEIRVILLVTKAAICGGSPTIENFQCKIGKSMLCISRWEWDV